MDHRFVTATKETATGETMEISCTVCDWHAEAATDEAIAELIEAHQASTE